MNLFFKKTIKPIFILLFFFTIPYTPMPIPSLFAVTIHPDAGTTSAAFLKLGIGSRAVSMGNAYVGLSDDVTALYWNPAGLTQLKTKSLGITHNESFEAIRHDFIGYTFPYHDYMLACALYGLYTPKDIERRSGLNESDPYEPLSPVEGYFQSYDMAAHFSLAKKLGENLSLGASLKIIQQTIDTESALGAGFDFGLLYKLSKSPLSLGFTVQNIGTKIKFIDEGYSLPLTVKAGAAYKFNSKFISTLDISKPIDNYMFISCGMEYDPISMLSLRAGYRYRMYGLPLGDLSGVSAGFGLNFPFKNNMFMFDYAIMPFGVLGNSHRISFNFLFGERKRKPLAKITEPQPKDTKPINPAPEIKEPKISSVFTDKEGYIYHECAINGNLKMSQGNNSIYFVDIKPQNSSIRSITGELRISSLKNAFLHIGEKDGENEVFKYFNIKKNFPDMVQKAKIEITIPKNISNPVITLQDGQKVKFDSLSKGENLNIYTFSFDYIDSFLIKDE